ncbi:MAG: hypothetical protein R3F11_05270 [Verrucomicrobiales bacterium]
MTGGIAEFDSTHIKNRRPFEKVRLQKTLRFETDPLQLPPRRLYPTAQKELDIALLIDPRPH